MISLGVRREPVAWYLMKVGDSVHNVIGEAYEDGGEKKKKKDESTVDEVASQADWKDLSKREKSLFISLLTTKILAIILVIFIYLCTLSILASAFTLLSSRGLGKYIRDSSLIRDPASALIIGMLITVVLQSSTTFTNVLVSMVAANIVHSLCFRESFKRAFSAAILGDVLNICCILIVLPIELTTAVIENISWKIVDPLISEQGLSFKTIEIITDPISRFVLEVDEPGLRNATINDDLLPSDHSFILKCSFPNGSRIYNCPYSHPFIHTTWSDDTVAKIVIIFSIALLIFCLFAIVALINNIMRGRVKEAVQHLIEKECPGKWKWATGYIIMAVGLGFTLLLQSNSVFSSSLTPLAGAGVISLKKLYALTMGSNIGTTFSGVLAAMAADPSRFEKALHMAVCQVIYNVIGTLLFYPIRPMRNIPLKLAEKIGDCTAHYRWFILLYLFVLFVLVPIVVISLSLLPPFITVSAFVLMYIVVGAVVIINVLQTHRPNLLPERLRSWEFLPIWMYSLEPYDKCLTSYLSRAPFVGKYFIRKNSRAAPPNGTTAHHQNGHSNGHDNGYDNGLFLRLANQTQV
ncbi:hypothetical protein PRIPAC_98066 [Pristionchus pacificus]|uniref:Uncharacterized protein n=1 Tax=Pristionchus pacificus TaxID=54126 RepID=A0A2A6BDN0_PRIPA|nr:hypothetical protein PRIPAC_98066 [Pristionchus pacificus]|eukprot:PDM63968.1 hypothetical protein PRIPAC_49469 [Pristionchus pacificus]